MADWGDVGASFVGGFNTGANLAMRKKALDMEDRKMASDEAYKGAQTEKINNENQVQKRMQDLGKAFGAFDNGDGKPLLDFASSNGMLPQGYNVQSFAPDKDGNFTLSLAHPETQETRQVNLGNARQIKMAMLEATNPHFAAEAAKMNAQGDIQYRNASALQTSAQGHSLKMQENQQTFTAGEHTKERDFRKSESALGRDLDREKLDSKTGRTQIIPSPIGDPPSAYRINRDGSVAQVPIQSGSALPAEGGKPAGEAGLSPSQRNRVRVKGPDGKPYWLDPATGATTPRGAGE